MNFPLRDRQRGNRGAAEIPTAAGVPDSESPPESVDGASLGGSDNSQFSEPDARIQSRLDEFARLARAANTSRGYRADWEHFADWSAAHGRRALPAEPATVAAYLADHADALKVAIPA